MAPLVAHHLGKGMVAAGDTGAAGGDDRGGPACTQEYLPSAAGLEQVGAAITPATGEPEGATCTPPKLSLDGLVMALLEPAATCRSGVRGSAAKLDEPNATVEEPSMSVTTIDCDKARRIVSVSSR
jgi:hypothetical protein